jgi:hypothetical protein
MDVGDPSVWISVAFHLFQLVHFGSFFPSFWVPNLRGHFEALNNVFRAHHNQLMYINYPNGAHMTFGTSSPRVTFFYV